jgi:hypothetical protein
MTEKSSGMIDESIISIDPSTTATGVAVFRTENIGSEPRLAAWSTIRPQKTKDSVQRCLLISAATAEKVREYAKGSKSVRVLIEMPGAQVRGGAGTSLITLGIGVGMTLKHLSMIGFKVEMVHVNKWTRLNHTHCLPKEIRAEMIRRTFPEYAKETKDKGLDAADAIGLGAWFLKFPLPNANDCGLPPRAKPKRRVKAGRC